MKEPDSDKTTSHSRILADSEPQRCLDILQLQQLEECFRTWAASGKRGYQLSRKRVFLIFLIIRYTGARLNEVLTLDPFADIDLDNQVIRLRKTGIGDKVFLREIHIPELPATAMRAILEERREKGLLSESFLIDPSHVRRKFYERAESIGIPPELGAPEIIRRSRAVEMMQSNVPLPVVQKILGHSTPNLAASYVEFSDDEIREAARNFADKENQRKTSARNAFFGKIDNVTIGDVQTMVEMVSLGRARVFAVITNYSQDRLGLKRGALATAEIKAPWVVLYKAEEEPLCSAENRFCGKVCRISQGKLMTEITVRIPDGTELCSIITDKSRRALGIKEDDTVWVTFSAISVVIHTD